jgi:ABC-type multidrug transport system fused ATPase/permease subunit
MSAPILLCEFAKENKVFVTVHTLVTIVIPLRDIVLPLMYSRVISAIHKRNDITASLALITCTLFAIQMLDMVSEYCDTILIPKLQAWVRRKALQTIFDGDDVSDMETGDVMAKLIKLPNVITLLFERMSTFVLPYVVLHAGAIIYLGSVDFTLGAVTAVIVVLMYAMLLASMFRCNHITSLRDLAFGTLHEQIDDTLGNLYSIHGSQTQSQELHRISEYDKMYDARHHAASICIFKWRIPMYPLTIVYIIFMMQYIRHQIIRRKLGVETAVPLFFVFMYLLNSFMMLDNMLKQAVMEWGTLTSCMQLLQPSKKHASPRGGRKDLPVSGLGMRNVTFGYDGKQRIFQDLSVHIDTGDVVAVMGNIGSGKSTLLKMFMGYCSPSSGDIYVDGMSYSDMTIGTLRKYVGYVPQNAVLFNRSIYENIAYGNNVDRNQVKSLLQRVRLLDEFEAMPSGLDTLVGKNGSSLSGGQRQLLWVLRVVLSDPHVLLLDEPTSSMDPGSRSILLQMLHDFFILKNKTIVMITHDVEVAKFARKVMFVENGRVSVRGRSKRMS